LALSPSDSQCWVLFFGVAMPVNFDLAVFSFHVPGAARKDMSVTSAHDIHH